MAVRVRSLKLRDYDAMVELMELCGLKPRRRGRDRRDRIARQLRSNRTLYLGAFDGTRLIGMVLGTHDTRKGWINRLAVHPDRRKEGLATRLVRACERTMKAEGIEIFAALIEADNRVSQQVFERLGYVPTDIRYYRRVLRPET